MCLLIVASCSKTKEKPEESKNEIIINGTVYPTTVIGNQTWTTVNYNGNGGVNYNDGANDPTVGKLYSFPELKALINLPTGWRVPTEVDVKALMSTVGTKLDGDDSYTDAIASQKLMSKIGWSNALLTGNNSTGLNLVPTGDCFVSSVTIKNYSDKGVKASFWTSTTIKYTPIETNSYPLLFEVSTDSYDNHDEPAGLRGAIYSTTASNDGITTFPAEKRSIRFVKDN